MAYIGAGGRQFSSSVLAKASMPGGYTRTVPRITNVTRTAAPAAPTGNINEGALTAIQKAKAYYEPGGGFGKGVEAGLERGRIKALASGMQGLVSAGLAGTTMAGTLGKKYEEEVGAPTRLSVEERRAQALSGISMQEAGMGFQAGQAGLQRSLQLYMARLQADLQREQMARRDRPVISTTAPTGGGYARQFPSLYDQKGEGIGPSIPSPESFGIGDDIPWPIPSRLPEVTSAELSKAFPMGGPKPSVGSVPYGRRTAPTIEEPPRIDWGQWDY